MNDPQAPTPERAIEPPVAQEQARTLSAQEQAPSPEEQAQYEHFVAKAMMLVYDKASLPKIVDMLTGGDDPIDGLARSTAMVVQRVMQLAAEAGEELGGDVLFAAAKEVFEDLAELSRVAKVKDYSEDEDAFEGAYFRSLDYLRQSLQGEGGINQEAAQADLAMLEQMDDAGELAGFFRDLAAQDDAGRAPPSAEESAAPEEPATEKQSQPKRRGLMQGND